MWNERSVCSLSFCVVRYEGKEIALVAQNFASFLRNLGWRRPNTERESFQQLQLSCLPIRRREKAPPGQLFPFQQQLFHEYIAAAAFLTMSEERWQKRVIFLRRRPVYMAINGIPPPSVLCRLRGGKCSE